MNRRQNSLSKQMIHTPAAVLPVGPFPQGVRAGDFLFVSGTVPYDSSTSQAVEGGIEVQTAHVMRSIREIVKAAGGSMDDLVKVTVHRRDVDEWDKMNSVYKTFSDRYLPARMTMHAPPPLGFPVDIDAVAYLPAGGHA